MKYLVTDEEMRMLDRNTTEYFKVPELVLMEQAAEAFVEEFLKIGADPKAQVVVACAASYS